MNLRTGLCLSTTVLEPKVVLSLVLKAEVCHTDVHALPEHRLISKHLEICAVSKRLEIIALAGVGVFYLEHDIRVKEFLPRIAKRLPHEHGARNRALVCKSMGQAARADVSGVEPISRRRRDRRRSGHHGRSGGISTHQEEQAERDRVLQPQRGAGGIHIHYRRGQSQRETANKAIAAIDAVIERLGGEGARVEIEGDTFTDLVRIIRDYTERLYYANSDTSNGKVISMPRASDGILENLRDNLGVQRSTFTIAA